MQSITTWPVLVGIVLLSLLLAANELGYRLGSRGAAPDEEYKRRLNMIRDATLALVTFLVGFSFAGAGSRYVDRQDLMVKEANAIGTSYLRAELLPEPHRQQLQTALKRYTQNRLDLLSGPGEERMKALFAAAGELQKEIWQAGMAGVGNDRPFAAFILPPLNDVIDLHSTHLSAARRHIPTAIMMIIVVLAAAGMVVVGYDNGLGRRRYFVLSSTFTLVVATSLWMTIDLDRPRHGLIRASELPYVELLQSLK